MHLQTKQLWTIIKEISLKQLFAYTLENINKMDKPPRKKHSLSQRNSMISPRTIHEIPSIVKIFPQWKFQAQMAAPPQLLPLIQTTDNSNIPQMFL